MSDTDLPTTASGCAYQSSPRQQSVKMRPALFLGMLATTAAVLFVAVSCSRSEKAANSTSPGTAPGAEASADDWARQLAEQFQSADGSPAGQSVEVVFGSRTLNRQTGEYTVRWGEEPFNAVKIIVTGEGALNTAPGEAIPVEFRGLYSNEGILQGEAIAFWDAPDLIAAQKMASTDGGSDRNATPMR